MGPLPGPGTPRSRATMRDVASRARVSLKTVSRVVNGEPGVTPATAEELHGHDGSPYAWPSIPAPLATHTVWRTNRTC